MAVKGSHGAVILPPDGSGKQVPQGVMVEVNYNNGTTGFNVGDEITFSTSTWVGTIVRTEGTVSTGELHVRVEEPVPDPWIDLTLSEDILVNAVKFAEVSNVDVQPYYFQQNQMVGNNMANVAEVDGQGALHVRYGEGSPQFDAFGRQQITEPTIIGEYINIYERDDKNFWYEELSGGVVSHIASNQGTLYSTTTTSGSKAASTTHLYHKYQLGVSQLIEMTVALGDSGKANVRRLWGIGDASDGLFFRMEENTALQVYMRSSTVGDNAINQSAWNRDRLDGSGGEFNPSGHTLDVTMDNIYWIDYQWLGAGRVRFGVIIEGIRITCHEMYHANLNTQPYIRTGSLPIHIGQANLAAAGSSSEMRVWCSVVKTEGRWNPKVVEHYHHIRKGEGQNGGLYMAAVTNWHPGRMMFAIRPKLTINSIANRSVAYPVLLSVTNVGSTPMFIQARRGASLIGTPSWSDFHAESGLEYNETDASNIDQDNRGIQVGMWSIPPNSTENITLRDVFGFFKERILLTADDSQDEFTYVFTAWNMSAIAGGADAGTYNVDINAGTNTIDRNTGQNFDTANYDGVAFAVDQMLYIRNSVSDDGYYIITAVTTSQLTVKNLDGSAVSFTGSVADDVTLQGGERSLFFGSLNVEEIV
jgi:hypothetical protein